MPGCHQSGLAYTLYLDGAIDKVVKDVAPNVHVHSGEGVVQHIHVRILQTTRKRGLLLLPVLLHKENHLMLLIA